MTLAVLPFQNAAIPSSAGTRLNTSTIPVYGLNPADNSD